MLGELDPERRQSSLVISPSSLVTFLNSPAEYHQRYILGKIPEQTEAMIVGEAIHCAVLEPNKFHERFATSVPDGNYLRTVDEIVEAIKLLGEKPTSKRKGDLVTQLLALDPNARILDVYLDEVTESGMKLLKPHDFQMCLDIQLKIKSHDWLSRVLSKGQAEQWIWSQFTESTIINGRMDFFSGEFNQPVILDIKTVKSAHPESFQRQIWNDKLYVQAAMYCDMVKNATGRDPLFAWVTIEKSEPYVIEIYAADFGLLEAGRAVYHKGAQRLIEATQANNFRGYTDGKVTTITLPPWAFNKLDYYADQET
jgi:hypothetical protein